MWVILNPKKASRFVTKGINLHKNSPTAFVEPTLELEFRQVIDRAIIDGRLIRVQGNDLGEIELPKQAKLSGINNEDTDIVATSKTIRDDDGTLSYIISMPDQDGNVSEKPRQTGVIITDIKDEPLEEEDDREV